MDNIQKVYEDMFLSISNRDTSVEERMESLKSRAKFRANLSLFIKFAIAVSTLLIGITEFKEILIHYNEIKLTLPRILGLSSAFLLLVDSFFVNPNKIAERLRAASNSLYNLLTDRGTLLTSYKAQASRRSLQGGDITKDEKYAEQLIDLDEEYSDVFGKINIAFKSKQPAEYFAGLRIIISEITK